MCAVLRPRVPGWLIRAHSKSNQLRAIRAPDVDAIDFGSDDCADREPDDTPNLRPYGSSDRETDGEPDRNSNCDPHGQPDGQPNSTTDFGAKHDPDQVADGMRRAQC